MLKLISKSVLILNFRMFFSNSYCYYVQSQNQDVHPLYQFLSEYSLYYFDVLLVHVIEFKQDILIKEAGTEANWDFQEIASLARDMSSAFQI